MLRVLVARFGGALAGSACGGREADFVESGGERWPDMLPHLLPHAAVRRLCLPNLLKLWCRLCGSNTRPTAYKAVALPLS